MFFLQLYLLSLKNYYKGVHCLVAPLAALACTFIKNEFFRIYYAKIVATETDKPLSYLHSNFFVENLPNKCFYNELVTPFSIKKREKFFK